MAQRAGQVRPTGWLDVAESMTKEHPDLVRPGLAVQHEPDLGAR